MHTYLTEFLEHVQSTNEVTTLDIQFFKHRQSSSGCLCIYVLMAVKHFKPRTKLVLTKSRIYVANIQLLIIYPSCLVCNVAQISTSVAFYLVEKSVVLKRPGQEVGVN